MSLEVCSNDSDSRALMRKASLLSLTAVSNHFVASTLPYMQAVERGVKPELSGVFTHDSTSLFEAVNVSWSHS